MKNLIKNKLREGLLGVSEELNTSFSAFHGSPTKINSFVDDFVGGKDATDQSGPGIYFTTNKDEAYRYAENGYIYSVEINTGKFLESKEQSESYLRRYEDDVRKLIMMAPDWEMDAQNWSEDPQTGLDMMVDGFIKYNTNEKDVFLQVWIDVYRGIEVQYVRNMVKLGYSGVFVPSEEISNMFIENAGNHVIVYNPSIIKFIKVEKADEKSN